MADCGVGDHVNVEVDVLARYLDSLLREGGSAGKGDAADGSLYSKLQALGF
jgi:riboflavin synthase alpha subunit